MSLKKRTRAPATATFVSRLNLSRKEREVEIETEIKDIYKKIGVLAIQQREHDKIIDTVVDDDETESSFRNYRNAVNDKKKCDKDILELRDKIRKKRSSILKQLSGGRRFFNTKKRNRRKTVR